MIDVVVVVAVPGRSMSLRTLLLLLASSCATKPKGITHAEVALGIKHLNIPALHVPHPQKLHTSIIDTSPLSSAYLILCLCVSKRQVSKYASALLGTLPRSNGFSGSAITKAA
ncbi:uncharacterized protein CLUP02_08433 [Colletotrichum lupini]|uniref:Uncharacterized protein n=1 Tax=Colletotrichum lupini TaxID=145971 RepID=A0A9Q8WGL8_9PEZI|nr:uncharacterized protein CLUP02_08433 [Colletotrichum lupini]UQC82943.1 hypothetical protein CLUP02_08433 [Colletotrichum lupini]